MLRGDGCKTYQIRGAAMQHLAFANSLFCSLAPELLRPEPPNRRAIAGWPGIYSSDIGGCRDTIAYGVNRRYVAAAQVLVQWLF